MRRGFQGSSSEHLSGDFAVEQNLACGQEEPCERVPRNVCRNAEKKDDYKNFYELKANCLKLGIPEDSTTQNQDCWIVEIQHLEVW